MLRRCTLVLATACLASSCHWITGPDSAVALPLRNLLRAPGTALRDFGLLIVESSPADSGRTLSLAEFVDVQVRTSGGDAEVLRLHRRSCGADGLNDCHGLTVATHAGHPARNLWAHVRRMQAYLTFTHDTSRSGAVWVFEPLRRDRTLALLRALPTVHHVDSVRLPTILRVGGPPRGSLAGALPIEYTGVERGDGTLQVFPLDTITAYYRQPDGRMLLLTMTAP